MKLEEILTVATDSNDTTPAVPEVVPVDQSTTDAVEGTDQRVPLDRFRSVTAENTKLRDEVEQLAQWKKETETAQLSELDRERVAREESEAKLVDALARAATLERSTWIREAAAKAGFIDPEDAALVITLDDVADADEAAKMVDALAARKPHLLGGSDQPKPMAAPMAGNAPDSHPDPKMALGADILAHIRRK